MALTVQLNTRVDGRVSGSWNQNLSYYDPVTGVNLNLSNPTADVSAFSQAQLTNISEAVHAGVLSVVSGSVTALPAATAYNTYGNFVSPGSAGGPGWSGITGVAQAEF